MAGDTARDLVRVIEIWQKKEITVIGPPVNTISDNPIQVYFGSLHYYFGLVGIIIFNFNPAGSVFINIVLTISSIPFFFLLSKKILKGHNLALLSTLIYSLSPITIALARSYWNPNLIIPLSVFTWYLFICKKSKFSFFLAGILSGIILNLHYMNFIPIGVYLIYTLFNKEERKGVGYAFLGFIIMLLPFVAFEVKNHFFLIRAFVGSLGGFSTFSQRTLNPFLSIDAFSYIFGLGPPQYFIPALFNFSFTLRIVFDVIFGIFFVYYLFGKQKIISTKLSWIIIIGLLVGWYFEKWHIISLRYILSVYPLLIIAFVGFLSSIRVILLIPFLIPMLILSFQIITHKLDPTSVSDYYPINTIKQISDAIVTDRPSGKYNVTENILGDARSTAFRYYLMQSAVVQPQPVEVYDRIDTLYVISPSLEKIYQESRWEFNASGPKHIVWVKDFGDIKLFKFVK